MIRINRTNEAPASLVKWGTRQTIRDCVAFDLSPTEYSSGESKFPKKDYYKTPTIKRMLVEESNSKCVYCEKHYDSYDLQIDHFRPRSAVRPTLSQKSDEWPGYYWLAYQWNNLVLSCGACNGKHKRTLFPLSNPTRRARSHHDPIERERPLFINPVSQEPRRHIRFKNEKAIGITKKGRATIDGIGLNRVGLKEDKLDILKEIRFRFAIIVLGSERLYDPEYQALVAESYEYIDAAARPDGEFSSMSMDFVASLGL